MAEASDGPGPGGPYASLVLVAYDMTGGPLLLLSDLAEHTQNLKVERRASLLLDGTVGRADPLSGARLTLMGEIGEVSDPLLMARFCRRHPSAAIYRGFADFHLFRMAVDRGHLVAGFGEIHWIDRAALLLDPAGVAGLAAVEEEIVAHMNADHADAVALIAGAVGARAGDCDDKTWQMTGLDPEGADFRAGGTFARADFVKPVATAAQARGALVRLTTAARRNAATAP
jgi:putative heme iron utilization protein